MRRVASSALLLLVAFGCGSGSGDGDGDGGTLTVGGAGGQGGGQTTADTASGGGTQSAGGHGGEGGFGGERGQGGEGGQGGGGGGQGVCTPGDQEVCYTGPNGTAGVGICTAGMRSCLSDGSGYAACMGETLPTIEDCSSPADEDCDGTTPVCAGAHLWSHAFDFSANTDFGHAVASDGTNVFVAGAFQTSLNGLDGVVMKLDSSGTTTWTKPIAGPNDQAARAVAADASGNFILVGHASGPLDLGGGPLPHDDSSPDYFVAKFDGSGSHLWSKRYGGISTATGLAAVAIDGSGNVLLAGYLTGTFDFGGGALTSAGGADILVVKLDAAGNHVWSKRFGDLGDQYGSGIAVDGNGNVLVSGSFSSYVDFGGGTLTSAGATDAFVLKLDPSGNHIWSKRFGDASSQSASEIAVGANGIVVAGSFAGAVDFGTGSLSSAGNTDIFLATFDADGNCQWANRFGGTTNDNVGALAVDALGLTSLTGSFVGTIDFGGGPLVNSAGGDGFIAKFAGGAHLWSKQFQSAPGTCATNGVAIDAAGNAFIMGDFSGAVDFGGGPLLSQGTSLPFAGTVDVFVAKLAP